MTVREIPLPNDDARGHPDGVESLHCRWVEGTERIVVDPMPSRIVGKDLDQPGGDLRVLQRRIEDRAVEPDVPCGALWRVRSSGWLGCLTLLTCLRLVPLLGQERFDLDQRFGHITGGCIPDLIQVNRIVTVDQIITHPRH